MGTIFARLCAIAGIAAIYANLGVIAVRYHEMPALAGYVVMGLLALPCAYFIYMEEQHLYVDRTFLLILAFGMTMIAATIMARDTGIAMNSLVAFLVEGVLLYLLVVNAVRDWKTLNKAVWAILIAAALIGTLCLYQDLTNTYDYEFGGLAQRGMNADAVRKGILYSDRAQGQIGETNRFAQSMLVLLPLAIATAFAGKTIPVRITAAIAGLLIFLGMLTTYSRGAIVAVAAMTIPMLLFRLIRLRTVLVTGVAAFLIIGIVTPMFIDRIASIAGLQGLFVENSERQPDTVTKKRLTEMTAALFTFLDHPMLGVGPGQYTPFYSLKYQTDPEASFEVVDRPRRAHSLYAEMAAETGIVGITMFLVVVGALMYQLQDVAARVQQDRPELALMARAFWVGIFGYLAAAVFLHLAFQRYYWLLLALAGAMVNVIQREIEVQRNQQEL